MSMHYTTSERREQVKDKLLAAIDVGKRDLYVKYMDYTRKVLNKKSYVFRNSSDGFVKLIDCTATMAASAGYEEIVFGMEPTGHYWLNLARKLDVLGLTVVTVMISGSELQFTYL